jgi:hypothetical protein
MRFPSVDRLTITGLAAARRFPLVLLCGVIAALSAALLPDSAIEDEVLLGVLYASTLGLPLFLAVDLLAERHRWSDARLWTVRLVGIAVLVGLYVARSGWSEPVELMRYAQLSIALHLLVAVAPYLGSSERNGFWQYNRVLFLRFLIAVLFSVVLFVGLAVALAAVDNLFGVDVDEDTYFRMWCFVAFVFNTWYFLGGVPSDLRALEEWTDYPPPLKVLSQYILSPLVTLYLAILTLYLIRILITRVWPSGWIGYLVSSVATAGILSLLLLYPVEEREENAWIRRYARWFYVGMLPSIVMLLMAIWKRIDQYGMTERRYFLVVLSVWLAGVAVFYIVTRSRNIKLIPATLALIAVLTIAGPWGAYSVSRRSQQTRLEGLLVRNGLLVDGRIRPAADDVPFEDRREISAVVRYLAQTHGTGSIDPWFEGRLARIDTVAKGTGPSERWQAGQRAELIVGHLGLRYVDERAGGGEEHFSFFARQDGPAIPIGAYDYVLRNRDVAHATVRAEVVPHAFTFLEGRGAIAMTGDGGTLIEIELAPLIERAMEYRRTHAGESALPREILSVREANERVDLAVYVTAITGTIESTEPPAYGITSLSADFFFTVRPGSSPPVMDSLPPGARANVDGVSPRSYPLAVPVPSG